ncbi:glycosyl hydrolase family 2 [Adhaeribacter aerolatus]|uniref:Glycosyl hydrolase family 2 n=1 Tax=Adhaeribacter aerolatus TaxID=670289 RepID=A0A512B2A2_9BACT|nr:glycosyl hydrolase [Adhaeribacter aerolatus]GEO06088.1 glycosyl hydrolase family 2 [Adhaeribacter aerolatus]
MTSNFKIFLALALCGTLLTNCQKPQNNSVTANAGPTAATANIWPEVKKENRPWTRWWWMGSAVDEKNIGRLLGEYSRAGLGGVEIAPIYGAMGHESRYIEFLSPQWMNMLDFTVKQAGNLGMGVDMTQGTGWPFGGPQVKPEYAASKLIIQQYSLKAGQSLTENILVKDAKQQELGPILQAVMAYGDKGEILNITDRVNAAGKLDWTPKTGNWQIYAAFNGKTRQMVKRAAPGGVGYTLDHLNKDAVTAYLERFSQAFGNKNYGVRAFYNDSYEVYGADWTPSFLEEFQKRRGYDLRPYLRELVSEEKTENIARLKADYRETMSEMVLENFTRPWTAWAHQRNSITKNQAHGSPGNLLDLYAAVDIPEGETFGSSYFPIPGLRRDSADIRNVDPDPIMLKFASSGAHASGKNLISSETFTWLGEHFKTSFSQGKPEVEQVFLAGVNHVFYHGVTYSPEDVAWPGWLFYASLNLTPANSLWPHFRGLNDYITRTQSVLQAGKPDNELAIYWPVYDFWNQPEGRERLITVHSIDEWLHPTPFYKQVKNLMATGYSLDFVSDKMLAAADVSNGAIRTSPAAPAHNVLLVPQAKYMPVATLQNILKLANAGATVIIEQLPTNVPGLHDLSNQRQKLKQLTGSLAFTDAGNGIRQLKTGSGQILLTQDVPGALTAVGVNRETLADTGLKFIRREIPEGKYYYLVNHTAKAIDTTIPLNMEATSVVIMDPQSGRAGLAATTKAQNKTSVRIQLQSGEALILKATNAPTAGVIAWQYLDNPDQTQEISGTWALHFTQGGPDLPADQRLKQLLSWTELPDKKAEYFSGTGEYTITFNLPAKKAGEYVLDLGKVNESARVWLNGQEVGILWSIPFRARVGQYLKPGKNTLKVEVANLMANRIRYMDQHKIEWRRYHEINFVNINYKPFDASVWRPMPSGLMGPVTLTAYSTRNQ